MSEKTPLMVVAEIVHGEPFEVMARRMTREGWTDVQIAAHFDVPVNTYKNWLNRVGLRKVHVLVTDDG